MRWRLVFTLIGLALSLVVSAQVNDRLKPAVRNLPTAPLNEANMNADTIQKLIGLLRTTPPKDFRAFVVIKDNKLVAEEYFNTYWRETIHDVRSAGKGVTALLLGIAIDKGLVKNVEQSIFDFFPATKFPSPPSDRHRNIKIKHLLMMSSGLAADDNDDQAPGNTGNWLTSNDWVSYALRLPMSFNPGEKYAYNDVCPMLIGAIIEETSGKKLSEFAKENLFEPLGIREFYWYTGMGGRTAPMGNLYVSALDLAKIGQLVLNNGKWGNRQIVSSQWIGEISKSRIDISQEDPFSTGYGYFWFIGSRKVSGKTYDYICASGNGGNLIFVFKQRNMVVALTSSAYGPGPGHTRARNVLDFVLRSVRE